ncbi:MAG: helical backbone metal receptor [Kofleriaceae bacterium]
MRFLVTLLFLVACGRSEPTSSGSGSAPAPTSAARLVSLTPSATEIIAALGATSLLVGVDEYSTYPPEVTKLPKVGSFMFPNLEIIVSLKPTLVVVDDIHGKTSGTLGDAGIQTAACAMHALPDVKACLTTVGTRIDRIVEATRVVGEIDAAIDAATAKRPAKRVKVLAIIDREAGGLGGLVAGGPGSWVDELLAIVGAENILAASGVRYPKISREEILRGAPDVILDLSYAARASTKEWTELDVPAVKTGRVVALGEPYLVAPSPRVKEALDVLGKATAPSP